MIPVVLLLLSFGLSLFFQGYGDIIYAPAILLLVISACVAVTPSFWRGCRIPSAPSALLLAVFWLYVSVSLIWSTVPFASLITYIIFLTLPLIFFSFLVSPDHSLPRLTAGFYGLLVMIGGLGLWAVIQVMFLSDLYGPRAHHPLTDSNNLACLLSLGFLPTIALLVTRIQRDKAYGLLTCLSVILFAGLLATQSRGAFLSLIITTPILLWALRHKISTQKKSLLIMIAAGLTMFAAYHFLSDKPFTPRLTALADPLSDPTIIARIALWKSTLAMTLDHLWTGTGFGTFYLYYAPYRMPLMDNSAGNWAHMDPLQYAAEMGLIAPILFYAFVTSVAFRTIKTIKQTDNRALIAGLSCALLAALLQSHVNFTFYLLPVLIICSIWLALLYQLTATDSSRSFIKPDITKWQKPVMAVMAISLAAMIALMASSSAAGQHYFLRALDDIKRNHVSDFLDNIAHAERFAPASFIDSEVHLAGLYIDILGGIGLMFPVHDRQTMFDDTLGLLNIAESMNPAWAEIDYKRARLYDVAGPDLTANHKEKAIQHMEIAVRKDPTHFRARAELAKIRLSQGRAADAYNLLEKGLQYPHPPAVDIDYKAAMKDIEPIAKLQKSYKTEQQGAVP